MLPEASNGMYLGLFLFKTDVTLASIEYTIKATIVEDNQSSYSDFGALYSVKEFWGILTNTTVSSSQKLAQFRPLQLLYFTMFRAQL